MNNSKRVSSIIPIIQNPWGTPSWGGSDMVKGKTELQDQKNRSAREKREEHHTRDQDRFYYQD